MMCLTKIALKWFHAKKKYPNIENINKVRIWDIQFIMRVNQKFKLCKRNRGYKCKGVLLAAHTHTLKRLIQKEFDLN